MMAARSALYASTCWADGLPGEENCAVVIGHYITSSLRCKILDWILCELTRGAMLLSGPPQPKPTFDERLLVAHARVSECVDAYAHATWACVHSLTQICRDVARLSACMCWRANTSTPIYAPPSRPLARALAYVSVSTSKRDDQHRDTYTCRYLSPLPTTAYTFLPFPPRQATEMWMERRASA